METDIQKFWSIHVQPNLWTPFVTLPNLLHITQVALDDEAYATERTLIQLQFKDDEEVITVSSLRLKTMDQAVMNIQIEPNAEVRFRSKGSNGAFLIGFFSPTKKPTIEATDSPRTADLRRKNVQYQDSSKRQKITDNWVFRAPSSSSSSQDMLSTDSSSNDLPLRTTDVPTTPPPPTRPSIAKNIPVPQSKTYHQSSPMFPRSMGPPPEKTSNYQPMPPRGASPVPISPSKVSKSPLFPRAPHPPSPMREPGGSPQVSPQVSPRPVQYTLLNSNQPRKASSFQFLCNLQERESIQLPSGLRVEEIAVGKSERCVELGDKVVVNFKGFIYPSKEPFDVSKLYGFRIGKNVHIKGWEQGIQGMRPGGKRLLTIPPELGYGSEGLVPKVPGNAMLIYEIELVAVE